MPSYSGVWNLVSVYQAVAQGNWTNPATPMGVFAGGTNSGGTRVNVMDYIYITTTGNATDFGDLTTAAQGPGNSASLTRGLFAGGYNGTAAVNIIGYITFSTIGNAIDFGDLPVAKYGVGGCSNNTRGLFAGGDTGSLAIDYVTIATLGNAVSFGNLISGGEGGAIGCASSTRGLFSDGSYLGNVISYVTIASTGNAQDFGDLAVAGGGLDSSASFSSSTRGVWAGGRNFSPGSSNVIQYVTIASLGNSTDFGDLTAVAAFNAGTSSSVRGVIGCISASASNAINYVTIASTGNAVTFGQLTVARNSLAACSNAHGGLS